MTKCKRCGEKKFRFIYNIKICIFCGEPKTERGKEKLTNMGVLK
jgi:ribosomal protein L37E